MNTLHKKICVDVGAEGGCWCSRWARDPSVDLIYGFEPNRRTFINLKRNTSGCKNLTIYEEAITNIDGTLLFYENNAHDTSSLLPFDDAGVKKWCQTTNNSLLKTTDTYNVKCIRLKTFMDRVGIDHIDFLKIDTQGQDLEVIKSLDDCIRRVKEIYLEVQVSDYDLYKNQSKKQAVLDYMSKYDFVVTKIDPQTCGLEENILFTNIKFAP